MTFKGNIPWNKGTGIGKKESLKKWRREHKEEIREYNKEYYQKNKENINKRRKKWRKNNLERQKKHEKAYYLENREYTLKQKKEYVKIPEVIARVKEYNKKYYQENKEREIQRVKEYLRSHNEQKKIYRNNHQKSKRKTDKTFKIICNLRGGFGGALKKYTKTGKIMSSIKYGIDFKAIIEHLRPFPENLKDYEIHHKKPLFTFDFINPDGSTNLKEVKKAFAPENHILLTKEEHRKLNHFSLKN